MAYQELRDATKQLENYIFNMNEVNSERLQLRINTMRMLLDVIEQENLYKIK